MRFINIATKITTVEFMKRIFIFFICFVFLILSLNLFDVSNPAKIGVPVFFTLVVFFSQFILHYYQTKNKTQPYFLGLSISKIVIKDFLTGIVLVLIVGSISLFIELSIGWVKFEGFIWQSRNWALTRTGLTLILLVVCQQLTTGWWEELVFRGYLIQVPIIENGFVVSATVSSILFGISHYYLPPNIPLEVAIIDIVIGFLLAYCYSKRGLWFTIGLHFAWNTFPSSVFGLINPGTSIIKLSHNYPSWTTVSETLIDPWLLLLLFILGVFFVRSKSNYLVSSDCIV